MLNRQRAILSILLEAGGQAGHRPVTKWAFILRHESATRGGSAFYQFLPYLYGPFSFCLFQEMNALARDGYVIDADDRWTLTEMGKKAARSIHPDVLRDVRRIVQDHSRKNGNATDKHLIDYVYRRYPWYTVNSKLRKLEARKRNDVAIYTAGYEGLLVDGFLNGLMRAGIARLIDVRNNPVSRRYGFHKSTLSRLCRNIDIEYIHFPQLGIKSGERQNLDRPGARQSLFAEYARTTLEREDDTIDAVARLVKDAPSVLVCKEACPAECHRSYLVEPIAIRTGLPIRHLELRS
jgi:uncharacterized protein (DUF488 family)